MNARPSGSEDVLYIFGSFTLDPVVGLLRQNGTVIPLPNKSFDLLAILAKRRGQLVAKEELLDALWPNVAVEENNLARHISNLRKVLDDDRTDHEFIVTVPGRGYRFVALVREISRADLALEASRPETAEIASEVLPVADPQAETPAEDIGSVQHQVDRTTGATLEPATGNKWLLRGFAVALAGVIVIGVTWGAVKWRAHSLVPTERRLWQLTFDPGVQMEPAWSPDGRSVAYAADRAGNFDIWVQPVDSAAAVRVTSSDAQDWQPAWSPDGRNLVFRSERAGGGLFVVPAGGGTERRISDFGYYPQWSSDGSKILFYDEVPRGSDGFGRANAVYVIDVDGTPARSLFSASNNFISFRAKWHPDGRRVSVWAKRQNADWSFWTSSSDKWNPIRSEIPPELERQLRTPELMFADFAWSPRGDAIFFEGREGAVSNIWRVAVDPNTLRWLGASRLTTGAERNVNITISPDGSKLAFSVRNEQTKLWSLPFDPANGRITGQGDPVLAEGADVYYDLSSDGRQLVYRTLRRGTEELWKRSLAEGHSELLLAAQSLSVPRFSRDGRFVVLRRGKPLPQEDAAVEQEVVVLAIDDGKLRLLSPPQRAVAGDITTLDPFDWSADGSRILSPCHVGDFVGICLMSLSNAPHAERAMPVIASAPDRSLFQAQFSPDERLICFNAIMRPPGRPRKSMIQVAPVSGGPWVAVTSGEFWDDKPRWSPDGRIIYYASLRNGFFNIWGRRFDQTQGRPLGEPFRVTEFEALEHTIFPDVSRMHFAVSNDRLMLPMTDVSARVWVLENIDR
jgi:Tol biopolymer transport system component/DNA-binding winged helix-turn-helix (wHTH) protein